MGHPASKSNISFLSLLCPTATCYASFALLANKKQFGSLCCCDLPSVNGPFIPCCTEIQVFKHVNQSNAAFFFVAKS